MFCLFIILARKLFPSIEWDRLRSIYANTSDEVERLALNYLLLLRTKLIGKWWCLLVAHVHISLRLVLALQNIAYSFLGLEIPEVKLIKKSPPAKVSVNSAFQHAVKGAVRALDSEEEYQ